MWKFLAVMALILCAGGAGGLATYLLQPPEGKEGRSYSGALRFIVAGAIVSLAVPLFLSLAQSSLTKNLFESAGDQRFQSALVLVGFCVVAGFTSRKFMDSLSARMMHVEQVAQQAEEKSEKAKEASEETRDLVEENIDRVAEVRGESSINAVTADETGLPQTPVKPEIQALGASLSAAEKAVLNSAALHFKRTLAGVSQDAGIPRAVVKRIVPDLVEKGLLQYATSANTGGSRIQVTPVGASVLNSSSLYRFIDSAAESKDEGSDKQ